MENVIFNKHSFAYKQKLQYDLFITFDYDKAWIE